MPLSDATRRQISALPKDQLIMPLSGDRKILPSISRQEFRRA
jgi:hypothetical protein